MSRSLADLPHEFLDFDGKVWTRSMRPAHGLLVALGRTFATVDDEQVDLRRMIASRPPTIAALGTRNFERRAGDALYCCVLVGPAVVQARFVALVRRFYPACRFHVGVPSMPVHAVAAGETVALIATIAPVSSASTEQQMEARPL